MVVINTPIPVPHIDMKNREHKFKKHELIGDAVLNVIALMIAFEIHEERHKMYTLATLLVTNNNLAVLARHKGMEPSKDDPHFNKYQAHPKMQYPPKAYANVYESYVGRNYLKNPVQIMQKAKADLLLLRELLDITID